MTAEMAEQSFNLQNFVVYILREFGPFSDTPEGVVAGMTSAEGEWNIAMTPEPDGTITISVRNLEDENVSDESV
jgi:hypothetical protein